MTHTIKAGITLLVIAITVACQPQQTDPEPAANGNVFTGPMEGSAFTIATGEEYNTFLELHTAFNQMDLDGVWAFSKDTVTIHMADGNTAPFTKEDMGGLFASMDSLSWDLIAVIPVRVEGSDKVNILVDGLEFFYYKDRTTERKKLFERFVFEDHRLTEVFQWDAAIPGSE